MTPQGYKEKIVEGLDNVLLSEDVADSEKLEAVDAVIRNLNTDTVNPDHATRPVIKGKV